MTKKILVSGLLIVGILSVGLYINIIQSPTENKIYNQFISGLDDDRIMIGASHHVFVAKIIKEIGTKDIGIGPETQFEVEIVNNIKGNLKGKVIVNQQAGYKDGILYAPHGIFMIKVGETYLFATRYNEDQNWHTISSHLNGKKLISKNDNLTIVELRDLSENDEKVIKFREAYKNEILLEYDVKANNTKNSYKSLQENK